MTSLTAARIFDIAARFTKSTPACGRDDGGACGADAAPLGDAGGGGGADGSAGGLGGGGRSGVSTAPLLTSSSYLARSAGSIRIR
jgi:hypothetical protein